MYAVAVSILDDRGNRSAQAVAVEAKTRAEALGQAFIKLTKRIRVAFVVEAWDISAGDNDVLDAIREDVIHRRKIPAIKIVRELTGMGLREAKEFVEDHWYDWPRFDES